ncbi:MAG: FAD-binding oxidoreductase [bacterium]
MEGVSYWLDRPYSPRPALSSDTQADVVVIGGGITGVSAAYHAVENGFKTILVEKDAIASGSAGKNGGMVVGELHLDLCELADAFGEPEAVELWKAARGTRDYVFSLVRKHRIDCDLEQPGTLYLGIAADSRKKLEREHAYRTRNGFDCALEEPGTQFKESAIGEVLYIPEEGTLHPVKFVRGLADIAEARGLRIFEGTPALRYDAHSVATPRGTISAGKVILATESALPDLRKEEGRIIREIALVTEPLSEEATVRMDVKRRAMFWGTDDEINGRWIGDRLFLNGDTALEPSADDFERDKRKILDTFLGYFPQLDRSELRFSHEWSGLLLYPAHYHPLILEHNGYYKVFGQNGNGLTNGIMTGKMIADSFLGKEIPEVYRTL